MSFDTNLYDPSPGLWRRILAGLYGTVVRFRLWLYGVGLLKSRSLPVHVISVGNLTVGGTGKTPTVIMAVRHLKTLGFRPAVLSRGYRGSSRQPVNVVSDGTAVLLGPSQAGDEPCLMARQLPGVPILTGRDRWALGCYAIDRFGSDVLVLDDGFQHLGLSRNVNLCLLDAGQPWGNGHLLPAGALREPMAQAARATAFLLTNSGRASNPLSDELPRDFPKRPVFLAWHRPVRLTELDGGRETETGYLAGRRVLAFCGLARPGHFLETLAGLGANVALFIRWPDHYQPQGRDLRLIEEKAGELGVIDAVTTAKDAVKLGGLEFGKANGVDLNVWSLDVEMDILADREAFMTMIEPSVKAEQAS